MEAAGPRPAHRRARAAALRPQWSRLRHRLTSARVLFTVLAVAAVAVGGLAVTEPRWVSPTLITVPLLAGAALLPMRWLVALAVVALTSHTVAVAMSGPAQRGLPSMAAFMIIIAVVLTGARARSRLGLLGSRGESMLFDLREHLTTVGDIAGLPHGWRAEVVHRSAYDQSFGGDFVVSAVRPDSTSFEIALVDVSGNGLEAATRALMLAGAFGGLVGSVPPEQFLPSANDYLLRQKWDEGFATGVHLAIDLRTGRFRLGSAGHPPAVHFHAGSGSWEIATASGPAFGLFAGAEFHATTGQLMPGDAMLLYTDGLVEKPDRDISAGLDRLLGEAERLVMAGFEDGADRLMLAVSDTESDDRACVLVWRR